MPFLKLDVGILDSSLWADRDAREVFITGLLMAQLEEFNEAVAQLNVRSLEPTGFAVPSGWYGFVRAAGSGIVKRAGLELEAGLAALERLGAEDLESRSIDHGGRRMIRVDGGYLVLNFTRYRDKDHTSAERAKRYRERKKTSVTRDASRLTRNVTHSDSDASPDANPKKKKKKPVDPAKEQVQAEFMRRWQEAYVEVHGRAYVINEGRDWKAASDLCGSADKTPEQLVALAAEAWVKISKSFERGRSLTVPGFQASFNEIVAELQRLSGQKPKSITPEANPFAHIPSN